MAVPKNQLFRLSGSTISAFALCACFGGAARAQDSIPAPDIAPGEDIVVTAQKRSERINDVGMSINAASGEQLFQRGVADISQLAKIVPGFSYNATGYGTPVYTIRGVGFQENSLGASPAVSVYVDEVPLPFSEETRGATLDVERVEVLKGPQGTFYGQNSTGGAINYVAAKPLDHFAVGVDGSYGRFDSLDLSGFATGPLTDTLRVRISARTVQSGPWQRSITRDDELGRADQLYGRLLLEWKPSDRLKVSLNLGGWRDRSDTQAGQLIDARQPLQPAFPNPVYEASPLAPPTARAADWDAGLPPRQNNRFSQASTRIDFSLTDDIALTSISSFSHFHRQQRIDTDGSAIANFDIRLGGKTNTFFQELRLAGTFNTRGHWLIGGNYQDDKVHDEVHLALFESSQAFLGATAINHGEQHIRTKAAFANVDYDLRENLTLLAGLRYTRSKRDYAACTRDAGDGLLAGSVLFAPLGLPPGSCLTALNDGTFGTVTNALDEDNLSWRVGVNYKPLPDVLLYGTVSKGWKSGSFPLVSLALENQALPVKQEGLLAYELGVKAKVGGTLQLNAAAFHYDYNNKQIRGFGNFPPFGALEILVNVPQSRVTGFEASALWRPLPGLTLSPAITLVDSKIKGDFVNYDPLAALDNFGGEAFPYTPRWSGNVDGGYRFDVRSGLSAFLGGNLSYRSRTNAGFGELPQFYIKGYALLDLRAGLEDPNGKWRASLWGQNVTNRYHWTTVAHLSDGVVRYAGRPASYGVSLSYRY